jgi:hypothetical protein
MAITGKHFLGEAMDLSLNILQNNNNNLESYVIGNTCLSMQ